MKEEIINLIKSNNYDLKKTLSYLNNTNVDKDGIVEVLEFIGIEVRVCSKCGKLILEGYVISDGEEYFCEHCLNEEYSKEEISLLFEDAAGAGENYWTEWFDKFNEKHKKYLMDIVAVNTISYQYYCYN